MLPKSNVIFNPDNHTYFLGDKQLKGVTGILSRQLFPDKYKDIPEFILKRAAERGSFVHECCELVDSLGISTECKEAKNYLKLKEQFILSSIENEYLISDEENYASSIDVVFEGNHLADIKTTSKFDHDSVSWQLSIYAYLFEMQTGLQAGKLYGIWLRDEISELIEVDRKPSDIIKELLRCDAHGEQFINPFAVAKSEVPAQFVEMETYIIDVESRLKELEEESEKLRDALRKAMVENNITKWTTERIEVIKKKDSEKTSFDSALFKKDHPDMYDKYIKKTASKGGLTIKLL